MPLWRELRLKKHFRKIRGLLVYLFANYVPYLMRYVNLAHLSLVQFDQRLITMMHISYWVRANGNCTHKFRQKLRSAQTEYKSLFCYLFHHKSRLNLSSPQGKCDTNSLCIFISIYIKKWYCLEFVFFLTIRLTEDTGSRVIHFFPRHELLTEK